MRSEEPPGRRLIADVPAGRVPVGRDRLLREVVAAMAGARPRHPVKTFSIGFEEEQLQRAPPRTQAGRPGVLDRPPRADRPPQRRSACCRASSVITASRSPTIPPCPPSTSPAFAREHVTVALNGDGGDESLRRLPALHDQPRARRRARPPAPAGLRTRCLGARPGAAPSAR